MKKLLFTTSWDDGSVHDLKVAEILSRHGMQGTFYVPEKFDGTGGKYASYDRRLSEDEIRSLAVTHEVGGHSLTHRRLALLPPDEADYEIQASQRFIEKCTGAPAKMFAFPGGVYNESLIESTQRAGFIGARTTKKLIIDQAGANGFLLDVTLICQPFPFRQTDEAHFYWRKILDPLRGYTPRQWALSWQSLARRWFTKALREGDYFHLYGHSWELEQYGMWQELDSFLTFVQAHDDVAYASNSEVIQSRR